MRCASFLGLRVAASRVAAVLGGAGLVVACAAPASPPAPSVGERAEAAALLEAPSVDPAAALAAAEALAARGEAEAGSARAAEHFALAARLGERAFRRTGLRDHGERAAAWARAAARDPLRAGGCEAALLAARLTGEAHGDAALAHLELLRAEQRLSTRAAESGTGEGAMSCLQRLAADRALLMAFAPDRDAEARLAAELAAERAPAPMGSAGVTTGPRILRVEPFGGRDAARVVVTLDRPAQHTVDDGPGEGTGGPRTVVELFGVEAGAHAARGVADGILAAWAVEATTRGARLVLDLDGPGFRRVFPLQEPYRLVVDVARTPPGVASPRRVRRIALDPGHGGADPGAVGPRGLREKDVALDIAHRAAPVLAREGLEVLLTRDDDRTVSLEERTARANAFAADLLLSIHCNSADNPRRRGVETYVLDTASDVVANRVAARENAASPGATAELGGILASLRIASHASHSRTLAELLQRAALASLSPYREVHDGGVHPAGFYVLLGARMPGALFETSYLSHPEEEERLRTEAYRQRLADAIVNAVAAYRQGR